MTSPNEEGARAASTWGGLSRRLLLRLFGVTVVGPGGLTLPARGATPGVTVRFDDCSTARVTNASAARTLSVYYARRFDRRAARYDVPATTTDRRSYRPIQVEYSPTRDRTTVTLAARGSLVRVVAEDDGGGRTTLTNDPATCVPPRFNDPPTASLVAATADDSASDGGTLVVRVGEEVTFSSTATDPDRPTERLRSEWDLDGDAVFEARGRLVTTTYAETGVVAVGHRVVDDFDEADVATLTVRVERPWRLRRKLAPAGLGPNDQFGIGVAVSDDTVVVGAPGDDDRGTDAGAAYVYDRSDLSRTPTKLTPAGVDRGDLFAVSTAIAGDSVVVSAACDDDRGTDAGAVYVYDRTDLSRPPTKLEPAALSGGGVFGFSLATAGETLVAGSHLDCDRADWAGSVFVFDLADRSTPPTELAPEPLAVRDLFGISVAATSEVVVAGAVGDDERGPQAGAVYVYDRSDLSRPPTKLAPDGLGPGDQFGRPVAAAGERLVVGVPFDDDRGTQAGAVYVYDLADLSRPPTRLVPGGLAAGDLFGYSVALSGDTLVVGAIGDDEAAFDAGAVYVHDLADSTSTPVKVAPRALAADDLFGFSVSACTDAFAVGALFDDDCGTSSGAVYVFER